MNAPDIWFSLYKKMNPNELSFAQFLELEREMQKARHLDTLSDEYVDYLLWVRGLPSRQELFAEFLAKKLPESIEILEVGGGRTHRLSRILSQKGFKLTCIDPKLDLTIQDEVKLIKEKFAHETFDLSPYGYVIAQEPCDATEHIIRACLSQKVPFIISLCGVPHKLISGRMPTSAEEWYNYLVNIDKSRIKFRNLSICPLTTTPILKSN